MDEENNGCLQNFLIIAIIITCCLIPSWALMWRNIQTEPAAITIGREAPRVEAKPIETDNPVFAMLVEKARAEAQVEIIQTEADVRSQGVDDEIRLRWEIHYMRRFWGWYFLVPLCVILGAMVLGLWVWFKLGEMWDNSC